MMHASPGSSSATSAASKSSNSANAASGAAAKPADALFGPVMQQQTDARARAVPAAGKQTPARGNAGASNTEKPTEPAPGAQDATTATEHAATTAESKSVPLTGERKQPEAEAAVSDNEPIPLLTLAQGNLAETERQLQQGKNLPVGGNNLPVSGTANLKGQGLAASAEHIDGEIDSEPDLLAPSSRNPADNSFANFLQRGGNSQSLTAQGNGDNTNSMQRQPDALFAAALQKAGAIAPGMEQFTKLDGLADTAGNEKTPELPSALAHLASLTSADKLQAMRPAQAAVNTAGTAFQLDAQPGSANWNHQVADSIRWMSKANISVAELKLNPAELGTIEVKIFTEDQQTRVSFVASNAATREMIESTLPRLREMLLNSGLQLEQSDISHSNDSGKHAQREDSVSKDAFFNEPDGVHGHAVIAQRTDPGQIDHYV